MKPASQSQFLDVLSRVSRKLRTMFDSRVREQGLTLSRARLLLHLTRNETATQRDLAEALEIGQASLVTLLDGLEAQGMIVRVPLEGDRRANQIHMTDAARAEAGQILSHVDGLREQLLAGIEDEDLATALKVLKRVGQNIETGK